MNSKLSNAKPFLFETSFDDPTTVKLSQKKHKEEEKTLAKVEELAHMESEVPPPPSFSEEELETAKKIAFENGRQAGLDEANIAISNQTISNLQIMTAQLAVLHDKQELANETHAAKLAQITGEILSKLLPYYAHTNGAQEIQTFIRDCISPILDDSRVVIHLSTEAKDHLEAQLIQISEEAGFEGRLLIIGDPAMELSDAKVDWDGGGAERNWDDIWVDINEAIKHATHQADVLSHEKNIKEQSPLPIEEGEVDISVKENIEDQDVPTDNTNITADNNIPVVEDLGSGDQNGG